MAKLSEADVLALMTGAVDLVSRLAVLLPTLAASVQNVRDGLAETDADALNDKIVAAHDRIQDAAQQLEALRDA